MIDFYKLISWILWLIFRDFYELISLILWLILNEQISEVGMISVVGALQRHFLWTDSWVRLALNTTMSGEVIKMLKQVVWIMTEWCATKKFLMNWFSSKCGKFLSTDWIKESILRLGEFFQLNKGIYPLTGRILSTGLNKGIYPSTGRILSTGLNKGICCSCWVCRSHSLSEIEIKLIFFWELVTYFW